MLISMILPFIGFSNKGEEPRERHVFFGAYNIQYDIWKHQFPATYDDKRFVIVLSISLVWIIIHSQIQLKTIIEP